MINLIISVFGVLLLIGGFYFMYLGFKIPPNPVAFFVGLIASVLGLILIIVFGSRVDLSRKTIPKPEKTKTPKKAVAKPIKPSKIPVKDQIPSKKAPTSPPRAIKPKPREDTGPKFGPMPTSKAPIKKDKVSAPSKALKSTEKEKSKAKPAVTMPPDLSTKQKVPPKPKRIAPVKKPGKVQKPEDITQADVKPSKVETPAISKKEVTEPPKPPIIKPVRKKEEKPKPVPKSVLETADKERLKELKTRPGRDDQFVKDRLDKLKENYIQNAKDIESIIDERLDSFKGTIDKLKTDSTEPSIIWSFEAQDVQEAMKDTISTAENKLLMMYPWVRNIDVSILKKFMDTESRIIIQEASLDDDASVELIKLLQEKNVQIRTMPHVHTVAIVADDANGLIISTDPIYESYEVGVIYKDKKSISEIERMFEDAWGISQDVDLGMKA
ncbi:MAG: hypothetical protein HVN35_09205 [Methanobacteriaceae archaeon]|nr:hypothetical protein [Methanobacteriaceae archaeon]